MTQWFLLSLLLSFAVTHSAHAQFDDLKFKQALKVKKDFYMSDGAFTGGDRTSSDFTVSNVRVAANPAGYDRVVIDLIGNNQGEKSALARPPFYLVEVDSAGKRILITLYGLPKLAFSTMSSIQSAKKAKIISDFEFTPLANKDRWTWAIHTRQVAKAEVFELTSPARIIIDLK
jgi:hypothetical protein